MLHIFLSPHLDDAVACCGGLISQLGERDADSTFVYNVFSKSVLPPYSAAAQALHQLWKIDRGIVELRRAEDLAAVLWLGAKTLYADFPEALYRQDESGNWLYPEDGDYFRTLRDEDRQLVEQLYLKFKGIFSPKECKVYAPLAIGKHVDHLLVHEVGRVLLANQYNVIFYEDFPYVTVSGAKELRFLELTPLVSYVVALKEVYLERKIDAFAYYRSQIPMIFQSEGNMRLTFRRYATVVGVEHGGFGERYWSPDKAYDGMQKRS